MNRKLLRESGGFPEGERHRCASPNHRPWCRSEARGCFWRCPRCRKVFCSDCEGTDDGLTVCDTCAAFIYAADTREDEAAPPPPRFALLVRRWAYPKRVREVLARVSA